MTDCCRSVCIESELWDATCKREYHATCQREYHATCKREFHGRSSLQTGLFASHHHHHALRPTLAP